jgi:hypothetical protein
VFIIRALSVTNEVEERFCLLLQYRFFSKPFQKIQRSFQLFFASFGERCIDFSGFGEAVSELFRIQLQRYYFFVCVYYITASAGQHSVMQKPQAKSLFWGFGLEGLRLLGWMLVAGLLFFFKFIVSIEQ